MKKVLIVEDNEMNLELITRRLKKKGFEICVAKDGEAALHMIRSARPDLVLLDMNIPKIDGWTVAKECKQDLAIRDIPIIALTAYAMQGDRAKALEAGCDEYETKPLRFKELLKKIEKFAA